MSNQIEKMAWSDLLRNFFAPKPKDVDGVANQSSLYYRNWCLRKIFGVFEISGAPTTWDLDYLYQHLFLDGYISVTDTDIGVIPLKCGITGINVFEHPTTCIFANPVLGNFQREIGRDCELVKIQYNYQGVSQMIQRYSTLLAMCDSSVAVNLMNTKVANVFGASSKQQAETMKKMYDEINSGRPAVFINDEIAKKLSENVVNLRVKESYIADSIQILKQNIMNDFMSEIGIQNANTEKRERLIESEINSNRQEVMTSAQHWLDNIKEGFDNVNAMFGLNLTVKIREYREEVKNNGNASESDRV